MTRSLAGHTGHKYKEALTVLDYLTKTDGLSATTVAKINEAHSACCKAAGDALSHAMRCGDLLAEAKATCGHGTWQAWLAENFTGSQRTARVYMQLAASRGAIDSKRQGSAVLGIDVTTCLQHPGVFNFPTF